MGFVQLDVSAQCNAVVAAELQTPPAMLLETSAPPPAAVEQVVVTPAVPESTIEASPENAADASASTVTVDLAAQMAVLRAGKLCPLSVEAVCIHFS
jgi:hypothetical protein